jgi:UDP-N-acetylmuramyl pentapeptide phosphotransferase/UDP-N-acetylglucosamine-1-phosphate transferase
MTPGIWFYAAFFTSVWLWLYVASGAVIRLLYRVEVGIARLRDRLNVDEKPITAIGGVAILLVSVVYWAWTLLACLTQSEVGLAL